jgi:hypothetical protein
MRKELIKTLALCLPLGLLTGLFWDFLEHAGLLTLPENPPQIETWAMLAIGIGGVVLLAAIILFFNWLRKNNRRYAAEEKDERNQAIYAKAGLNAWGLDKIILAASGAGLYMRGYTALALIFACLFAINTISMLVLMVYYSKKM